MAVTHHFKGLFSGDKGSDSSPNAFSGLSSDPTATQLTARKNAKTLADLAAQEAKDNNSFAKQHPVLNALGDAGNTVLNVGKGAVTDVAGLFKDAGNAGADVIANLPGGANDQIAKAADNTDAFKQKTLDNLQLQLKKTSDPTVKKRIQAGIAQVAGETNLARQTENSQLSKEATETAPKKTLTNAAEGALDLATLGTGGAAVTGGKAVIKAGIEQAAKTAGKEFVKNTAKGATIGGAYGEINAVKNNENLPESLKSVGQGAAIGAAFPIAGKILKGGAQTVSQVVGNKAGKAAQQLADTQAAQDAQILKDKGVTPIATEHATQGLKTPPTAISEAQPGSQVGKAVENVATPEGADVVKPGTGQSRYISKTIPNSEFVGAETKDLAAGTDATYNKTSNAIRADQSLQQLDTEGTHPFADKINSRLDQTHITDQTVFDAQAAAQALEKDGSPEALQKATDIYSKLSKHLTKNGQIVQAASILAKQTPQGLRYQAQKSLENAGVKITPELQDELTGHIKAVQDAVKGSPEEAVARDNVQYFIAKNIPSSKADQITNLWKAGLLTSPTTTAGNLLGNAGQYAANRLIKDPVSVLSDLVISAVRGKGRTIGATGLATDAKGFAQGIKTVASKQFRKTGFNPNEVGETSKFADKSKITNYGTTPLGKAVGGYVNGVYKVMGGADLPFREAERVRSLTSQARAAASNQGLKGSEKTNFVKDFVKNPPTKAAETAQSEAEKAVFGDKTALGSAATALQKIPVLGNVLVPFAKVTGSIATKVITGTPIGIAKNIVEQVLNVRKGGEFDQRALARAIGEGTTAVPIIAAGAALVKSGDITGGYPQSPTDRAEWIAEGKQPNSVKIGDRWYSLNYLQPFASWLSIGATIGQAQQAGLNVSDTIQQAASAATSSLASQSFVQGLQGFVDAATDPVDYAKSFVTSEAGSLVPNAVRAFASATDPNQRDTSGGVSQGILSGIPGLRETLPTKKTSDGTPIPAKDNFLNQFVNPFKPSTVKDKSNADLYDQALSPAKDLKAFRTKQINSLINEGKVSAAQRAIDTYNSDLEKIISPYVGSHQLTDDQTKLVKALYLGSVGINSKGQPFLSTSKNG